MKVPLVAEECGHLDFGQDPGYPRLYDGRCWSCAGGPSDIAAKKYWRGCSQRHDWAVAK